MARNMERETTCRFCDTDFTYEAEIDHGPGIRTGWVVYNDHSCPGHSADNIAADLADSLNDGDCPNGGDGPED